jgi:hypothetical protein
MTSPPPTVAVDLRELLRIDIDAELRKLTVAQLQGPWQLPAELVRRGVRAGAERVEVQLARGSCVVRDDGAPLAAAALADLAAMLDAAAPAEHRHRALLALEAAGGLALLALAGIGATQVEVVARGGGKQRRLVWSARQGRPTLSEAADPGGARGTEVVVRGAELDPARARAWLKDVARFAPGSVREGGEPVNTGLRGYLASERFTLGARGEPPKLHGHVAVAAHGEQARVWLLQGGVVATHLGLSSVPCFDAVVELGDTLGPAATAADLRAAMNPHLGALADVGVGLLMQLARRLPETDHLPTQARIVTLLLQAVRTRRRLRELMQVPMLPCWTPAAPQASRARPARWVALAEVAPPADRRGGEPPVVLALYPEQDPEAFALPEAPVLRLDAAERSALTELLGLRFRAPPPRTDADAAGRLRAALRRGLRRTGQALARLLHLGPGAPLADAALTADERELLASLRAVLRGAPGAPEGVALCEGAAAPQVVGGPRGQLVVGRAHPDLRACAAALRRGPAWLYPAAVALLAGQALPATAARVTWLRHWQDPG